MRGQRRFDGKFWAFVTLLLPLPAMAAAASLALSCMPDFGTIGALLGQRPDGRLFVRETPRGLAAARQGMAPGDEILLVDGKDVRQMGERELYRTLSGDVGSKVKLTIARGDSVLRVTLVRTPAPPRAKPRVD